MPPLKKGWRTMINKQEIVDRLKSSRTWREFGYTIAEVLEAIENDAAPEADAEPTIPAGSPSTSHEAEIRAQLEDCQRTIKDQRATIKRLRSENKRLSGEI